MASKAVIIISTGNKWYNLIANNYSQLSIDFSVSSRYSSDSMDYYVVDKFVQSHFEHYSSVLLIEAGTLFLWGTYERHVAPNLENYEWTYILPTVRVWQPKGTGEQNLTLDRTVDYIPSDTEQNFLTGHTAVVKNLIDDSNMSYLVHNELPVHGNKTGPVDWAMTVSSGFFINSLLQYHGYHKDTVVHHIDISKPSLQVRKYTIENWDGKKLGAWIDHVNEKFPTIGLFNRSQFSSKGKTKRIVWDALQNEFGDGWLDHWRSYQKLQHHFHRVNITDPDDMKPIFKNTTGNGVIWWNGALKRMPGNLLKDSNASWKNAKQFISSIPGDTICYGGDHCLQQYNGISASEVLKEVASENSRDRLWKNDYIQKILLQVPKKVGVSISGGADSALLLYMLCQAGHECVLLTIDRTSRRHQLPYAKAVVDWIQQYYPDQINTHYIRTVSEDNIEAERRQIKKEIERKHDIDTWLNGMTSNPPVKFDSDNERDTRRDKDLTKGGDKKTLRPFYNIDKSVVIALYHSMCIEELLDVSFSCEVSDPACGKCWWCEEREWAINEFSTNT